MAPLASRLADFFGKIHLDRQRIVLESQEGGLRIVLGFLGPSTLDLENSSPEENPKAPGLGSGPGLQGEPEPWHLAATAVDVWWHETAVNNAIFRFAQSEHD